jgi:hypothetical protein
MQKDSLTYDSVSNRPLPEWLINQKEGLNTVQPKKIEIKEDKSLSISFAITLGFLILAVAVISLIILRKHKN